MTRGDRDRLQDARDYLLRAVAARKPFGMSETWDVRERRQSLVFDIVILGEALAKASAETKTLGPWIPWRIVNAKRHRLVHAYWLQDRDFIEEVVGHHLPPLLAQLDELIAVLESGA